MISRILLAAIVAAIAAPLATAGAIDLVDSSEVQNNSLRSADVKNNTLRSKDVADGTLRCKDLKKSLRDAIGGCKQPAQGPQGQPGPTGGTGQAGPTGPPGDDAQTFVTEFPSQGFNVTNDSCSLIAAGVECGPYANGGAAGGSLFYSGANGLRLDEITQLAYTEKHQSDDGSAIAAPYLRIFLEGDTHDVIFDPTECATAVPEEGVFNTYEVTTSGVRYDDDSCDGVPPDQQSWDDILNVHSAAQVSGIYITTGFTNGTNLRSLVKDLTVNGEKFVFGS